MIIAQLNRGQKPNIISPLVSVLAVAEVLLGKYFKNPV